MYWTSGVLQVMNFASLLAQGQWVSKGVGEE